MRLSIIILLVLLPSISFGQLTLVSIDTTALGYEFKLHNAYLTIDLGTDTAVSFDHKEVKMKFKNISNHPIHFCQRLTCYADGIFPRSVRQRGYKDNLMISPNEIGEVDVQIRLGRRYGNSRKSGALLFYSDESEKQEELKLIIKARIFPPSKVAPNNNSMIKH